MVIATITSGLGNQLFQYALARHLSLINRCSLYFDLRFYKSEYARETSRSFKLNKFNIAYKEIDRSVEWGIKVTKLFPSQTLSPFFRTLRERHYHFDPEVLEAKEPFLNVKGYWHSERYFRSSQAIIRNELQFNNPGGRGFDRYLREIQHAGNAVSVHVRRGDYVHHPEFSQTFGFIGLAYYEKAMEIMTSKVPDSVFFIFTDDKSWVLENFPKGGNYVFVDVEGSDADLDDLHLMKTCRHHIIANSSYSWWGAWLNGYPDKIVIAPKEWFRNQPDWNTKDLLPESWLKI
ncbi:MAG: alpha-1,2-fucosyltransferase [Arcticibacter sp.]